jgi:hypothetical protein
VDLLDGKTKAPVASAKTAHFKRNFYSTCHTLSVYTTSANYDVDLLDERGQREFNHPICMASAGATGFFTTIGAMD